MKALLATAAAAAFVIATPAFAQAGPVASAPDATADATIVQPIAVNQQTGLNFGRLAAVDGGTLTVDANGGAPTSTPGMIVPGGTPPTAGVFNVSGEAGLGYSASVDGGVQLNGPSGSTAMQASLVPSKTSGILVSGADSFSVGGTLTLGTNQTPGAYHGTYHVTVQYN